jgi:ABC-type multidrug transport system ATPase subunit
MGTITGDVYINGQPRTRSMMKSTAYVMQENAHIGSLTVHETLYFAAQLRLPQEMPDSAKEERIVSITRTLGLENIMHSVVGNEEKRGISGGQKKRLSIGVEIIHLPEMIFFDEPTSGLDSAIAYEVMFTVRQLANQNRTILCTIHQPSAHTFEFFDKVMILVKGEVFYYGKRAEMVKFFTSSVYKFKFQPGSNPADFVMGIGSETVLSDKKEKVPAEKLVELYQQSEMSTTFNQQFDEYLSKDAKVPIDKSSSPPKEALQSERKSLFQISSYTFNRPSFYIMKGSRKSDSSEQPTSELFQIQTLVYRQLLCKKREKYTTIADSARYIFVALFYGSIFYSLDTGTDPTVYTNRLSIIYFSLMAVLMSHQEDIPLIHEDRIIFYRERASNVCTPMSYWISRLIVAIPFDLANVFLYALILYYMVGFRTDKSSAFWFFVLVLWFVDFVSLFICQFVAFISSTTEIAMSIFPIILFFITAFQGFIIYLPEFPDWLGWAANLSYMRFAFQSLVLNEFQGNSDDLPDGDDYIDMLGFNTISKTECVCLLIVFFILHGLSSMFTVQYFNFEKR